VDPPLGWCDDSAQAQAPVPGTLEIMAKDRQDPTANPTPVPKAWDLRGFGDWLSGRAEETRRAYLGDMTTFARWMERSDVGEPGGVDRLHLRRYLASLGTRQLARATVARKAAALRCYFAWAVRQGLVPVDPARTLRAPSGKGRLPRVLSSGEIGTLLDDAGTEAVDLRDRAALELLYAAGLRVSELCGLDRRGVDLRARTVTVLGTRSDGSPFMTRPPPPWTSGYGSGGPPCRAPVRRSS
jgi:integrase/recombinase XerC